MRIRHLASGLALLLLLPGRPGAAPAIDAARRDRLDELVDIAGTLKRFDVLLYGSAPAPVDGHVDVAPPPPVRSVSQQCKTANAGSAELPARFCESVVAQFAEHDLRARILAVVDAELPGAELDNELAYLKSPAVHLLARLEVPLRKATAPIERDWIAEASRIATATLIAEPASLPKAPRRAPWLNDVLLATIGVDRAGLRHRLIESARRMIDAPADRWSSPAMTTAAESAARRYEDAVETTLGADGEAIATGLDAAAKRQHEDRMGRINEALLEMWGTARPALDAHVAAKLAELRAMTPAQRRAAYPD